MKICFSLFAPAPVHIPPRLHTCLCTTRHLLHISRNQSTIRYETKRWSFNSESSHQETPDHHETPNQETPTSPTPFRVHRAQCHNLRRAIFPFSSELEKVFLRRELQYLLETPGPDTWTWKLAEEGRAIEKMFKFKNLENANVGLESLQYANKARLSMIII